MSKIKRRFRVVELHQGNYEAELAELLDQMWAAKREEEAAEQESGGSDAPRRVGEQPKKKESVQLALKYDALLTKAEKSAEKVTVWAVGHDEWSDLADLYPPRVDVPADDEKKTAAETFPQDRERGVNVKTFPPELLKIALVDPGEHPDASVTEKAALGAVRLRELGLSRLHYVKLESAAWNVNVEDDALPKFSLVSLLKEESDGDSKPPNDSA